MKKLIGLVLLTLLVSGSLVFAQESKFKKIAKNGTGNIIFSNEKIVKDAESKVTLKTKFSSGDVIWARAYFSKKFGTLEDEAEGFMDIWIDGEHVKRYAFSNNDIKPDQTQMAIYVHNTGSDDFKDDIWGSLDKGEHKVKIVVGKTEFMKAGVAISVQGDDVVAKQDDTYQPIYLSESDFQYTVQ